MYIQHQPPIYTNLNKGETAACIYMALHFCWMTGEAITGGCCKWDLGVICSDYYNIYNLSLSPNIIILGYSKSLLPNMIIMCLQAESLHRSN